MNNMNGNPVVFTAKVSEAKAYESGLAVLKVFLSSTQLKEAGVDVGSAQGKLVHIKLQRYEYEAWREDQETFPKVFGTFQFTADAIEHRHLEADLTVGRNEPMDWYEVIGFMPTGQSTGKSLLPEFDKIIVKSRKTVEAPKGF